MYNITPVKVVLYIPAELRTTLCFKPSEGPRSPQIHSWFQLVFGICTNVVQYQQRWVLQYYIILMPYQVTGSCVQLYFKHFHYFNSHTLHIYLCNLVIDNTSANYISAGIIPT